MLQEVEKHFSNKTPKEDINEIKKQFLKILKKIRLVFGSNVELAKLVNDNPSRRTVYPNLTLLDVLVVCFIDEDEKLLQKYRDKICESFKTFFTDEINRAFIQNSKKGATRTTNPFSDRVEFLKSSTLDKIRLKYGITKAKRLNIRDLSLEDRLLEKQNGICLYCKNQIKQTDEYEIDHLQSLDDFGSNEEINLALLHKSCNREKSNKKILL